MSGTDDTAERLATLLKVANGLQLQIATLRETQIDREQAQDRRINQLAHRIATLEQHTSIDVELLNRIRGLEALARTEAERISAVEMLAGIRAGHMGKPPADSDPVTITDHAPNAPR